MRENIVLFVDDEENILHSIKRVVADEDFTSLFASNGEEALHLMKNFQISVLITDMMMPKMNGLSLLLETKSLYPETIRVILSGQTELSKVLAAINQGDIFRFITKPWNTQVDLLATIRQSIEYYNLRQDKKKLEQSLRQRNTAYKNMLRNLEMKKSTKQGDIGYLESFLLMILDSLEHDFNNKNSSAHSNGLLKVQLVRDIVKDYFQTLPIALEEFSIQDVVEELNKYLVVHHYNQQYQIKVTKTDIQCSGNYRFLMMILTAVVKILCHLGSNQSFKHSITSQKYQEKGIVRINHIIEFGYVDGAKLVIDSEELLSYANLEFYSRLLAQIGQHYEFDIGYTYVSQNISLMSLSAEFSLA